MSVKTNAFRVRPVMTASILLQRHFVILSYSEKKVKAIKIKIDFIISGCYNYNEVFYVEIYPNEV